MKKITLVAALLGSAYFANAQVGIGTPTPADAAMLHIEGNNKGVIIPNVSLNSTSDTGTVVGDEVESLLVYNTNTTGDASTTGVTPGFYYWHDSAWQRITTKAELDAAIGNVTNIQADINKIKDLLQVAYPANNLDTNTTADTATSGGGMIFTPASGNTASKIEYVYFDGTSYVKQDITIAISDLIKSSETKTTIVTYNKKQYYLSESFTGDSNTANWTVVPAGAILIDVVGGVVNNFSEIIGDTTTIVNINGDSTTIAQYFQSLASTDSNTVYFNNTTDTSTIGNVQVPAYTFYLKDVNGNAQTIDLAKIVKATETVTTLIGDLATAVYTYTNEKGDTTTINIPASVVNNIQKILGDTTTIEVDGRTFNTVQEYLQYVINNGEGNVGYTEDAIAAVDNNGVLIPANSFYRVDSTGYKKVITFPYLIDNIDGTYTFTAVNGDTTTINIPASVVNNFEQILGDTTTYNNTQLTIKQIIEQIAADASGNMTYIPGADTNTLSGSSFVYTKPNGDTETITFDALVKANETVTTLERKQDTSTAGIVITYDYLNEDSATSTIDLTSDIKTLIEGNTDIKNAIQNILNSGGSVYYGAIDSSSTEQVLYTVVNNVKTPIDVASTLINNTTLTGGAGDTIIQQNINNLKNNLGDSINAGSNTSVFTGDTYVSGNTTYYVYKGEFTTTVYANTATTSGITLDKASVEILSATLKYGTGIVSYLTNVATDATTNKVTFNVGTGNMYNVLGTTDIIAKVILEFASTEAPAGL